MTNREAIDVLKVLKAVCEETFGEGEAEALQMAIDALEKWIPCSERLPDSKWYVLVTEYGETNIGRRFDGRWLDYCGDKMKDVTAWMPLPEPYKEVEHE